MAKRGNYSYKANHVKIVNQNNCYNVIIAIRTWTGCGPSKIIKLKILDNNWIVYRRKHEDSCSRLEQESPSFVKYLGSVYLAAIDAIVVCGYTVRYKGGTYSAPVPVSQQSCSIYYKHWASWHQIIMYENNVFYDGAFIPWHNRLGKVTSHSFKHFQKKKSYTPNFFNVLSLLMHCAPFSFIWW